MKLGSIFRRLSRGDTDVADAQRLDALTEVSRRRVIVNAASNYARYGVAFVVNLFLQAYIIRRIGRVEYSIWPLATTVVAFVQLIPLAVGGGVNRFLAHAFARKSLREVEEITSSVFAAMLVVTGVYIAAAAVFSVYFERIFDIPPGAAGVGPTVMLIVGISGSFAIPAAVFKGALDATQKFVAINIREIVVLVTYAILVVVAFNVTAPQLVWVAVATLVTEFLGALVTWRVARRLIPWQRIRWKSFRWASLRMVSSFGLWALLGSIATLLYWRTGNIIVNKLLDPVLLTGYSVVVGILLQGYSLASLGSGVLFSAATVLHARHHWERMARMIYRAGRVTTALGAPAILFLAFFGRPIMVLYLGDSHYGQYGIYFAVLGGAMIIQLTQIPNRAVPPAFGKNAVNNMATLLASVVNVALSLFFVTTLHWGLMGVAAAAAIVIAIYNISFWPWYSANLLEIGWLRHFVDSTLVPLAHCVPASIVVVACWVAGLGSNLVQLVAIAAAVAVVHLSYMMTFGLQPEDRRAVLAAMRRLLHIKT
jgi:O-antigen/teichoic acid export membrane protein